MTAEIIKHPATTAQEMADARLRWMRNAAYFFVRGDDSNCTWCQGRASGLNDAIIMLGGQSISMRVADYVFQDSGVA